MKQIPVTIFGFNRSDLIRKQIEFLSKIEPQYLIIILDGPRKNNKNDEIELEKTKDFIYSSIEWKCELITDFNNFNLGCKNRIISGLNFVFSKFEMSIILEDDCIPSIDFFEFCSYCLEHYADDHRCMHISGHRNHKLDIDDSYYYSMVPRIWGWATWRRAWNLYDSNMIKWNHSYLDRYFKLHKHSKPSLVKTFDKVKNGTINTWDYQWMATILVNNGYCLNPTRNLIENHGFDSRATHTSGPLENMQNSYEKLIKPIVITNKSIRSDLDSNELNSEYYKRPKLKKIARSIWKRLGIQWKDNYQ